MGFEKAKKEQLWAKILLNAPSGGGKTYSALKVAAGIAKKCGSRVAAIDTENGRIKYYADEFDFDDLQLTEPYAPEKYIEAVNTAVDAGYKVLIVDSVTHEWNYCLDLVSNIPGTNSYVKWKTVTPRHNAFVEKIIQSPIYIISTVRGKDEYVLDNSSGKNIPKKVGLGYSQRDGLEFEYTITLNLDQTSHRFTATKDNTHLFEGRFDVLTEKDGEAIYEWANSGEAPVKTPDATHDHIAVAIDTIYENIASTIEKLVSNNISKTDIGQAIKEVAGTANYKKITDIEIASKILKALEDMD